MPEYGSGTYGAGGYGFTLDPSTGYGRDAYGSGPYGRAPELVVEEPVAVSPGGPSRQPQYFPPEWVDEARRNQLEEEAITLILAALT